MKLGIFAKIFAGSDPKTVLSAVASAGFSAAQYNMICSGLSALPDAIPNDAATEVAEAAKHARIEIVSVSGTYNMIHPDAAVRARGHRDLEILAAACTAMSTRLITLCTGTRDPVNQWRAHPDNDKADAWRDLVASMATAAHIAEVYDVDLGIEPELANVVNSAEKARRLIDEIGSPRIKVVLDPANLFDVAPIDFQRRVVASAIELLADRIVMGHAKDRTQDGRFTTAGKGVIDFVHYLKSLKAAGFSGALVAHGLDADEAPQVASFLRRTLDAAGVEPIA
ncbi:MAG: sugar phosphate isomerase/epimerase [Microvirga sp.]